VSWTRKPLEEVADFSLGKMLDENKNKGQLLPYLANINVRWGSFELDDLRQMRFGERELDRFGLKAGDIVMCEGGEPGRCAIWQEQIPGMVFQKALHRIRPHDCIDSKFLFYRFLKMGRNNEFSGLFTGATIKHLPKDKLAKVIVAFPEIEVQRKIAEVLSAYDDLIENNRRRIALLEQAARLLYEEWFVRFRFPGHERAKFVNGLPDGWKRICVTQAATYINRGITPVYDDEASCLVINQKCIRGGRLETDLARRQSKKVPEEKLIQFGDVLINSTGEGTLGRVAQVLEDLGRCTVDSHVTIVRPRADVGLYLFGMSMKQKETYLSGQGRGATNQTELSKETIQELTFDTPSLKILTEFETKIEAFQKAIVNLVAQNKVLASSRDLLLPRLMSGEVEV
jgi:type I restriction enzyme S subunit